MDRDGGGRPYDPHIDDLLIAGGARPSRCRALLFATFLFDDVQEIRRQSEGVTESTTTFAPPAHRIFEAETPSFRVGRKPRCLNCFVEVKVICCQEPR
jgi:hypothetical protein